MWLLLAPRRPLLGRLAGGLVKVLALRRSRVGLPSDGGGGGLDIPPASAGDAKVWSSSPSALARELAAAGARVLELIVLPAELGGA